MTAGWRADGNTNPRWRSCEHVAVNGRCSGCNARSMGDYKQERSAGRGAVGLNDAEPVMKSGTDLRMKGDESSKDRFMRGSAHIDKETRRRAA